jgi:hypothetical protein
MMACNSMVRVQHCVLPYSMLLNFFLCSALQNSIISPHLSSPQFSCTVTVTINNAVAAIFIFIFIFTFSSSAASAAISSVVSNSKASSFRYWREEGRRRRWRKGLGRGGDQNGW